MDLKLSDPVGSWERQLIADTHSAEESCSGGQETGGRSMGRLPEVPLELCLPCDAASRPRLAGIFTLLASISLPLVPQAPLSLVGVFV
jgi:hypothetical protein